LIKFFYNNKIINLNEKIETLLNDIDNDNKNILIQVHLKNNNEIIENNIINKNIIQNQKSEIICPKCFQPCRIKIENYLIKLFGCINDHIIENIELDEYIKIQQNIQPKVTCKICSKNNDINEQNKGIHYCTKCQIHICSDCTEYHEKKHNIEEYQSNYYLCIKHKSLYTQYCQSCKYNICSQCIDKHKNHKIVTFEEISPNIGDIKKKIEEIKKAINLLDEHIKEIINDLNKVKENMEIYYNIYNNIFMSYDEKNKNYEILQNLNEINNDNIVEEINHIINYETKRKGYNILNIFNKMKEYNNEITINYKLNTNNKKNQKSNKANNKRTITEEEINVFGANFVEKYKFRCT
jgi:hypothetical protein